MSDRTVSMGDFNLDAMNNISRFRGKEPSSLASSAGSVALCQRCKKNPESPTPHRCPYQYEINAIEDEEYCSCCDECREECKDSI